MTNAKAYPGADIDSDHNPVVTKLKLKEVLRTTVRQRGKLERMKDEGNKLNK